MEDKNKTQSPSSHSGGGGGEKNPKSKKKKNRNRGQAGKNKSDPTNKQGDNTESKKDSVQGHGSSEMGTLPDVKEMSLLPCNQKTASCETAAIAVENRVDSDKQKSPEIQNKPVEIAETKSQKKRRKKKAKKLAASATNPESTDENCDNPEKNETSKIYAVSKTTLEEGIKKALEKHPGQMPHPSPPDISHCPYLTDISLDMPHVKDILILTLKEDTPTLERFQQVVTEDFIHAPRMDECCEKKVSTSENSEDLLKGTHQKVEDSNQNMFELVERHQAALEDLLEHAREDQAKLEQTVDSYVEDAGKLDQPDSLNLLAQIEDKLFSVEKVNQAVPEDLMGPDGLTLVEKLSQGTPELSSVEKLNLNTPKDLMEPDGLTSVDKLNQGTPEDLMEPDGLFSVEKLNQNFPEHLMETDGLTLVDKLNQGTPEALIDPNELTKGCEGSLSQVEMLKLGSLKNIMEPEELTSVEKLNQGTPEALMDPNESTKGREVNLSPVKKLKLGRTKDLIEPDGLVKGCEGGLSSVKLNQGTPEEIANDDVAAETKVVLGLEKLNEGIITKGTREDIKDPDSQSILLTASNTAIEEPLRVKKNKSEKNVSFKLEEKEESSAKTEGQLIEGKSKAQLKAERKAAFEAQKKNLIKEKGEGEAATTKTKSELRAERRAKQEAQREAKARETTPANSKPSQQQPPSKKPSAEQPAKPEPRTTQEPLPAEATDKNEKPKSATSPAVPRIIKYQVPPFLSLYSHYPSHEDCLQFASKSGEAVNTQLPYYLHELGLDLASRRVYGTMCSLSLTLNNLRKIILEYETPPGEQLSRDLEAHINSYASYLDSCWPMSLPTKAIITDIRQKVTSMPASCSDQEAKDSIVSHIDKCLSQDAEMATDILVKLLASQIRQGQTIITHSASSLVRNTLVEAHRKGTKFRVCIVDSGPLYQGFDMLEELMAEGVDCTYLDESLNSTVSLKAGHGLMGVSSYLASGGSLVTGAGMAQLNLALREARVTVQACFQNCKLLPEMAYTAQPGFNIRSNSGKLRKALCELPTPPQHNNCLGFHYDTVPRDLYSCVVTEKAMQLRGPSTVISSSTGCRS